MAANQCVKSTYFIRYIKCIAVLGAVMFFGLLPVCAGAFDILLGTGEAKTFSHFTGRMLCRVINSHSDEIHCQIVPAPDAVHNLTNIRSGSLDIGIIDSHMLYDALHNKGYFEFLDISYETLRCIAPLYELPTTLIVRRDSKISSLGELKGKRINAGAPRSRQHLAFDTIMQAKNWKTSDFRLFAEISSSLSQDTMAFCHGEIEAMVHIGVHPDPSLQKILRHCRALPIDMDDGDIQKLVDDHPAFSSINIDAGTYQSHPRRVKTFGATAMLVASEDLDEQTVVQILAAIYGNQIRLKSAHPALSLISLAKKALKIDTGIQMHPGAAEYYSQHGM